MTYQEYIRSALWLTSRVRLAELQASGHRCRLCNAGRDRTTLEVHHRTYENLGNEQPGDLTALCRSCHRNVTSNLRGIRYAKRKLLCVDVRPALENPSPLFDPTCKQAL